MKTIDKKIEEVLNNQHNVSLGLEKAHEQFLEMKEQGIIKDSSYDIPLMNRLTVRSGEKKKIPTWPHF